MEAFATGAGCSPRPHLDCPPLAPPQAPRVPPRMLLPGAVGAPLAPALQPILLLLPLLIAACALAAGCQGLPLRSPCADVDCSGHGTCVLDEVGGELVPTCLCDAGYGPSPSGWLCFASADDGLCAGVGCSGRGRCAVVNGSPRCVCDPGYWPGPDGLGCADPCAGITCSGHGSCEVIPATASPSCRCDFGFEASADKKSCVAAAWTATYAYALVYDSHPDYRMGRATIDLSQLFAGRIEEKTSFRVHLDHSGRGLARRSHHVWELSTSGSELNGVAFDEEYTQGKVTRRRAGRATFADGQATVELQRLDQRATFSVPFAGPLSPIPMAGGFEYPGWTLGCFSPAFYIEALGRYDMAAGGTQRLEVFWPESAAVGSIRVAAAPSSSASRPVLDFPDQKVSVTYGYGLPETIKLVDQGISWVRYSGAAADLNLDELPPASAFVPEPLPSNLSGSALEITAKDGVKLAATLTVPSQVAPPWPAILFVGDLNAIDRDRPFERLPGADLFWHLAAHLAEAGFASLRYDPRGTGSSGGDADAVTLATLTGDISSCLARLKAPGSIAADQTYLLSLGSGSVLALSLLEESPSSVKGFVAIAPLIDEIGQAVAYSRTEHVKAAGFSSSFVKNQSQYYLDTADEIAGGTFSGSEWLGLPVDIWKDLLAFDGTAALVAFSGPVLLLRGDQDMESPPTQLQAAADAASAAGKTSLTTETLAGRTFLLTEGAKSDLWELAHLPLDLPADSLAAIKDWLLAN